MRGGYGGSSLLGEFTSRLQEATGHHDFGTRPESVGLWAERGGIRLDRGRFTFERHEYLREPYSDAHPRQVEMKCAQMGNSVKAMLTTFYCARFMPFVGILYLFPSKSGVGDFVRSRVNPLVEENPDEIGVRMRDTDSVGLKRMCGTNLIFRGTKSPEGLRSDPCDMVLYDEYDLMPAGVEEAAKGRLGHSDFKWERYLSNPTIPDYGIDRLFQLSDQRHWLVTCPKCGGEACMEDHPLEEILWETGDGVIRLCPACRDAALDVTRGRWVAKYPSVTELRGYHYSQLFSSFVDPADILHGYRTTKKPGDFYNYVLGQPYIEAENRLSREQILALCGTHGVEPSDRGPCVMGVDQGRTLHVVVARRFPASVVYLGTCGDWEELDRLMVSFNVACCVVDAQPEMRPARAFAQRHPGKVFCCFYSEQQRGGYAWNEGKQVVTVNRTESLDDSQHVLLEGTVALPRVCGVVETFAAHCNNLAKKLEEREDGSRRYVYVKLSPEDHFRHAMNYMTVAMRRCEGSYYGDCDMG
ncbi:hypothetical protein GGQ74_000867 [Desulfobaculum xiamenense]|uniref:Phage terminase large subunit GpA ATPase domain-containing protein n=1 Tax=Desulfobaculum xiamenense TaxID=995050 RepID=A0A846QJG7_9BACT|nr:phage terminase large subunit family protein [Desulfobaculum xiamenense]NJB67227.1 hypothetical protein [Desulfobaculum xiamenense]